MTQKYLTHFTGTGLSCMAILSLESYRKSANKTTFCVLLSSLGQDKYSALKNAYLESTFLPQNLPLFSHFYDMLMTCCC